MNESARESATNDETQVSSTDATQENEHQTLTPGDDSPQAEADSAHSDAADSNAAPANATDESREDSVSDDTAAEDAAVEDSVAEDDFDDDDDDEQYSGDEDAKPIEMIEDYDGGEDAQPIALGEEGDEAVIDGDMKWYILKVQSNREDSIRDALVRRMKIAGLERYVDQVIVPKESLTEYKNGRKRIRKNKIYPGYIVVHMVINEETWFLVRETPGIGDFTGAAGKPTPMLPSEVDRIKKLDETEEEKIESKLGITYEIGQRVKVTEGNFENMEGDVEAVDTGNQRITVLIQIFGRPTPVELEYWQVQTID